MDQLGHILGDVLGAAVLVIWGGWRILDRFMPKRAELAMQSQGCPVVGDQDLRSFIARLTSVQERLESKQDMALSDHRVMDSRLSDIKDELRRLG